LVRWFINHYFANGAGTAISSNGVDAHCTTAGSYGNERELECARCLIQVDYCYGAE
jgi:hypothetical protein